MGSEVLQTDIRIQELANDMYDITVGSKHCTLVMLDPAPHYLVLAVSMGTDKLQWATVGFNGLEVASESHLPAEHGNTMHSNMAGRN